MILQALVAHYEALAAAGKIDRPGWVKVGVSYALELNESGVLVNVIPLKQEIPVGKKTVLRPQMLTVPAQVKKTSGVSANFLCENSSYFLGIDNKGKPKRSLECFLAAKELHLRLLSGLAAPEAQAVCRFFETWQPEHAAENTVLSASLEDLLKGANLVFWVNRGYVQEVPEICAAWQSQYDTGSASGAQMQCLITGKVAPVVRLHPSINGIKNGQSMGNSLVCFNDTADESYGHELSDKTGQGMNAPTSEYAAFAYGAALNHLLSDRDRVQSIGDTTVVCWSEDAEEAYVDTFAAELFGKQSQTMSDTDLDSVMRSLAHGTVINWNAIPLHPENQFYILGLAPNAARLSVRFFLRNTFGGFMKNLSAHSDRLDIIRPAFLKNERMSISQLLSAVTNQNARNPSPPAQLAGDLANAILANGRYPATMYSAVLLRTHAEATRKASETASEKYRRQCREMVRAAMIRAYLIRNFGEEVDKVMEKNPTVSYTLGCIFSVLEDIQHTASPSLNATIRDRYFNSASTTPAMVFPVLFRLKNNHIRVVSRDNPGLAVKLEKAITSLMNQIGTSFPQHLSLEEQGRFILGYYQQTQKRYEKKEEDKENV